MYIERALMVAHEDVRRGCRFFCSGYGNIDARNTEIDVCPKTCELMGGFASSVERGDTESDCGKNNRCNYEVKERENSPHFTSLERASMIPDTSDLILSSRSYGETPSLSASMIFSF